MNCTGSREDPLGDAEHNIYLRRTWRAVTGQKKDVDSRPTPFINRYFQTVAILACPTLGSLIEHVGSHILNLLIGETTRKSGHGIFAVLHLVDNGILRVHAKLLKSFFFQGFVGHHDIAAPHVTGCAVAAKDFGAIG